VSDHEASWLKIVESHDPKAAMTAHLAFLADSDECRQLLDSLMAQFVEVRLADQKLELVLRDGKYGDDEERLIRFAPPFMGEAADTPPSVVDVIRVHNGIEWEAGGGGWFGFYHSESGFGGSGGWECEALEEAAEDNAEFLAQLAAAGLGPEDVEGCCDFGQNWLIWHPAEKNTRGEPTVYFVSHGDCVAEPVASARELGFGPLLLRILAWDVLGSQVLDTVYT
jgi:hypothetical protein